MTGGAFVDHQAATRQHAFAMRQNDSAVDSFGIAEIVAVDYKRDRLARGGKVMITAHLYLWLYNRELVGETEPRSKSK
jgi:hypothetical protein